MIIDLNLKEERFYERVTDFKTTRKTVCNLNELDSNFEIDLYGKEVCPAFHSAFILHSDVNKHIEATDSIRGYCGPIMATHLFWDLDVNKEKGQELADVLDDAKELIERLDSAGADMDAVTVCFSGSKGVHIIYQTEDISSLGWNNNLHRIVKHVCKDFAEGIDSFDDSIYDRTRIIRATNSKHNKTGMYKIPFTVGEFLNLTMAEIKVQALEQKELWDTCADSDVDYVLQSISQAEELLEDEDDRGERRERKGQTYINDILHGIEFGFDKGSRDVGLARVAGMLNRKDFDEFYVGAFLRGINSRGDPLPDRDVDKIVRSIAKYKSDAKYVEPDRKRISSMRDCLLKYREMRKHLQDIETPFTYMNPVLKTFDPSKVMLIAARPGVGKTLFAMKLANEIVKYTGEHALFISLEMDAASVGFRGAQCVMSTSEEGLDNDQAVHQICNNDDFIDEVSIAWERFHTVDETLRTVQQIEDYFVEAQELIEEKHQSKIGVICIDYLQLMSETDDRKEFDRICRNLKGIAKRLGCRVIGLTQLSRKAGDGCIKPGLHMLRESGALEEVGNIIMGMWNDTVDENRVHVEVLKWREGKKGTNFDLIQRGMAYSSVPFYEAEPQSEVVYGR